MTADREKFRQEEYFTKDKNINLVLLIFRHRVT